MRARTFAIFGFRTNVMFDGKHVLISTLQKWKGYLPGLMYVVLCLLVGENHPFSLVPMYDSFPDQSYSFYLSNEQNKILPVESYFTYRAEDIAHNYYAIYDHLSGNETDSMLHETGQAMWQRLLPNIKPTAHLADTVYLHRVTYYLHDDTINSSDEILYAGVTKL